MGRLTGKVAIVTGSGLGIGHAAVIGLAREGARVVVSDINDAAGEATVEQIRGIGGEAFYQHADVGSSADMERLIAAAVERYGKLDVLVNNAGSRSAGPSPRSARTIGGHQHPSTDVARMRFAIRT